MSDSGFVPRSSKDAEMAVVGACFHGGIEQVKDLLTPSDFYSPTLGNAYRVALGLYDAGARPGPKIIEELMRTEGTLVEGIGRTLLECDLNPAPNGPSLRRYVEIVAKDSLARELGSLFSEGRTAMQDPSVDPGEFLDHTKALLEAIDSALAVSGLGVAGLQKFLDRPLEQRTPWAIPGLLRSDWRVVFVADEGVGKSYLLTQLAVMAAWGMHPFTPLEDPVPPVRAMIVDLENPEDEVRARLKRVSDACRHRNPWRLEDPECWLIHRPGGIDLRKRSHRLAFEADLRMSRPQMVVLGPVYKCYTRTSRESDEQVASEVQAVLDDLRTRYGFGLILEHHAPKAERGGKRELTPFGSSLWLRWSELGFSLVRPDQTFPATKLRIVGYRGDRVDHGWPSQIERGKDWPWVAPYEEVL